MKEISRLHPILQTSEFSLDDVIFPPQQIPDFEWNEVSLASQFTNKINLQRPIISSPMDTVTGSSMAILMAREGGIGVIHYNYPTIQDQLDEISRVRRFEAGFIRDPIVLGMDATVGDVFASAERNGFFSYPITDDGTKNTPLRGIVTRRDVRFEEDLTRSITEVMTNMENLKVGRAEDTLDKNDIHAANAVLRRFNLDTLPIVDRDNKVVALVTDSDLSKNDKYPNATKDENHQLKVFTAVESRLEAAKGRIGLAAEASVSGFVVDARNIYRDHIEIAKYIKQNFPDQEVILGNVVSSQVVRTVLSEAGQYIDGLRVGIGTGEVCTTTESIGMGRPMGSSINDIRQTVDRFKDRYGQIGLIVDGGIKSPAHILTALFLGADAVMMGTGLAGYDESPGEAYWDEGRGMMVKKVRGMGSASAIAQRAGGNRYMVVGNTVEERYPEGIEKTVAYRGKGEKGIRQLFTGVRQGMHGIGAKNIEMLREVGYLVPASRALSKGLL